VQQLEISTPFPATEQWRIPSSDALKVLQLYLPNVRPDCESLDGWPRIEGDGWAKSLQQYGEDATDLDSILLDSTTEFLS
jgi:hypothetical protein